MRSALTACVVLTVACSGPSEGPAAAPPVDAGPDAPVNNGPTVLAESQTSPTTIALDATNVYWVSQGTSAGVYKVPKAGGDIATLYAGPVGTVGSMAVDSTSIYLPIEDPPSIVAISIAGGGAPRTLASTALPVHAVALANGEVYWVEPFLPTTPWVAKKVPVGGGESTSIALPDVARKEDAEFMAVSPDSEAAYASLASGGGILRIPFAGNDTPEVIVSGDTTYGLAVDQQQVFYASGSGTLDSILRTGGSRTHLASAPEASAVAIDDASIYFIEGATTGKVLRVGKNGAALTVIAENQAGAGSIAVDGESVYWNNVAEGTIKKTAKR